MAETILILGAVLVLVTAGIILGVGMKKNRTTGDIVKKQEIIQFETKYDELNFLYQNGSITEDEYKEQVKSIIN